MTSIAANSKDLKQLIDDASFFFYGKVLAASYRVTEEEWAKHVRPLLPIQYRYAIDLDNVAEALGRGTIQPAAKQFFSPGPSVVTLAARYTFSHDCDAAIQKLVSLSLTKFNNYTEESATVLFDNVKYRLALPIQNMIIHINTNDQTFINEFKWLWNNLYTLASSMNHTQYLTFIQELK